MAELFPSKWHIHPVIDSDYEQWSALYHGYRNFYKQERSDLVVQTVWSWIRDPNHVTKALVAVSVDTGGVLAGLAHYRRWPRLLLGTHKMYLDDLFTRVDMRGNGVATMLINAVAEMVEKEGLGVVRWTTAEDNETARRLYDFVASATKKVTYDKVVESIPGSKV